MVGPGESGAASRHPGMNVTFFSPADIGVGCYQPRTMQAHELSQFFRMPEMVDFRQYVRTLPTNTLMGFGAFAALTTFWYATRPRALKPPCDLAMQSVQVAVSGAWPPPGLCLSLHRFQAPLKAASGKILITSKYWWGTL